MRWSGIILAEDEISSDPVDVASVVLVVRMVVMEYGVECILRCLSIASNSDQSAMKTPRVGVHNPAYE
jgi:hypothetical protein